MEGFFDRPRKKPRAQSTTRVHLVIEPLDSRDLLAAHSSFAGIAFSSGAVAPLAAPKVAAGHHRPLKIVSFVAIEQGSNVWVIQGKVVADDLDGVTVQLGGLPSLSGKSTGVDEYGWFRITVQLKPGESGTATAQASDSQGDTSNLARTLINPSSSYDYRAAAAKGFGSAEKAVQKGTDPRELAADSYFTILRENPDFQKLIQSPPVASTPFPEEDLHLADLAPILFADR